MFITFYGGAGEVTGSNSLIEIRANSNSPLQRILIDCGMYQGTDFAEGKNSDPLPFDAKTINAVLITHAHLDHVGRLPVLIKNGYSGYFYATAPTAELTQIVLEDALSIMMYDNKKFGRPIIYSPADVAEVVARFKTVEYEKTIIISGAGSLPLLSKEGRALKAPGEVAVLGGDHEGRQTLPDTTKGRVDLPLVRGGGEVAVTFHDSGHIFGAAFIEIEAEGKRLVFSGDVGNVNVPILRDTENLPADLDALVCESTYGDRLHESFPDRTHLVEELVKQGIEKGGTLMIPSFSIERTQELIYELNDLIDRHRQLPRMPIFLDSPMAIDAMKVYKKYPQYFDDEATRYFKEGDDLFNFEGLVVTRSREESMKINKTPGSKIIIAGAGMMNGGRILHHAVRYLSDPKSTLLIIGYQSKGTLGREITDGAKKVNVLGESVEVRCRVVQIGALSAHADANKLISWIGDAKPKKVFLNHGDPWASDALAKRLGDEKGIAATKAEAGMRVEV